MTVGDKVVCIDAKFTPGIAAHYTALPVEGRTYVIREMFVGCNEKSQPGEVGVRLVGLINPKSKTAPFPERGFNSMRFRLQDERKEKHEHEQPEYTGKDHD